MTPNLVNLLKDFFRTYLQEQRALSPHTVKSYRDTFKLLYRFLQNRKLLHPRLENLDVKTILAFLHYLEDPHGGRGNDPLTRNQRLLAIQSFFHYVSLHYPSLQRHAQRIRAIPIKRAPVKAAQSLNRQELQALLAQPSTTTSDGIRDLTILTLLYNTGARASEAAEARFSWFDFPNRTIAILGKGRKQRVTPLWPSTVRLLKLYADHHRRKPKTDADRFFINQRGLPFTRFGVRTLVKRYLKAAANQCPSLAAKRLSTHSLRHTCAVHLLESKVEPNVIKAWLGHASISSTSRYLDTDLTHKRRILEQFGPPPYVEGLEDAQDSSSDAPQLDWLDDL